ncbi:MAG: addiction module protein [Candidatus Riflebacteria bacterium]|nr:addiction module protein [Candidatus Riflebacteria bacterium]
MSETMRRDPKKLIQEALKLPPEARAAVAGVLIDSLDDEVDEDAEAAWQEEIAQRLAEVDSGRAKTVPWAEARRLILGDRKAASGRSASR